MCTREVGSSAASGRAARAARGRAGACGSGLCRHARIPEPSTARTATVAGPAPFDRFALLRASIEPLRPVSSATAHSSAARLRSVLFRRSHFVRRALLGWHSVLLVEPLAEIDLLAARGTKRERGVVVAARSCLFT